MHTSLEEVCNAVCTNGGCTQSESGSPSHAPRGCNAEGGASLYTAHRLCCVAQRPQKAGHARAPRNWGCAHYGARPKLVLGLRPSNQHTGPGHFVGAMGSLDVVGRQRRGRRRRATHLGRQLRREYEYGVPGSSGVPGSPALECRFARRTLPRGDLRWR
jgi:hypothetical protein